MWLPAGDGGTVSVANPMNEHVPGPSWQPGRSTTLGCAVRDTTSFAGAFAGAAGALAGTIAGAFASTIAGTCAGTIAGTSAMGPRR